MDKRAIHLISWDALCRPEGCRGVRLKRAADMNRALLAKLAWRLLNDEDAVWCQMVRAKYGVSFDAPLTLSYKVRASIIWRGIEWCSELLQQGLRWEVRDGERTRFWSDRWFVDYPLHTDCALQLMAEDLQLSVAAYWGAGQGWLWREVGDLLSASNFLKLSAVVLTDRMQRDQLHWLDLNGRFSVRSAYMLTVRSSQEGTWNGWMLIWRLRVQQRVRVFLWLLAHGRILMNSMRYRLGIAPSSACGRCGELREDVLHVIRDCQSSKEVWECL